MEVRESHIFQIICLKCIDIWVFEGWSAPSAIGTAGLGVGTQIGAEVTDFLIVLNSRSVCSALPKCSVQNHPNSICHFIGYCKLAMSTFLSSFNLVLHRNLSWQQGL